MSAVDIARLREADARPAGPPPAGPAPGVLAATSCVEVQRLVNSSGIITMGNQVIAAGSPLAGPHPLPPASPVIQRKVSSRGGIRVARQRIQVGLPHAGRIVTIELGDTTLRITDPNGEPLTVPRNSTGEISRFKPTGPGTLMTRSPGGNSARARSGWQA